MDLKTLMGDAYQEGVTSVDDINNFLSNSHLADLSTGAYVDKNKFDANIKAKDDQINKLKSELQSKMTDDEKAQSTIDEKDALIKELQTKIATSNKANAKSGAEAALAEAKTTLGIATDDKDFNNFLSSISTEDFEGTKALATYVGKLINDAYVKGQKDASKDNLGKFSKDVTTSSSKDGAKSGLGKILGENAIKRDVDSEQYFK
jgi:hypothetical protein